MGQFTLPSGAVRCAAFTAAVFALTGGTARSETFLVFRPARAASVLQTNQSTIKGSLSRISTGIVVIELRNGEAKEISVASVRSVKTNDGRFTWSPAQESFEKLMARADRIQGVTIDKGSLVPGARNDGSGSPASTAGPISPPRVFAELSGLGGAFDDSGDFHLGGESGYAGANMRPRERKPVDLDAVAFVTGLDGVSAAVTRTVDPPPVPIPNAGSVSVFICSNPACGKKVPGAKYGQKCPFCGVVWLPQTNAEVVARTAVESSKASDGSSGPPQGSGNNPFGTGAIAAGNSGPGIVATSTATAGGTVVTSSGFDIDSVPWWGKIGGFAALLAVLWLFSQRR